MDGYWTATVGCSHYVSEIVSIASLQVRRHWIIHWAGQYQINGTCLTKAVYVLTCFDGFLCPRPHVHPIYQKKSSPNHQMATWPITCLHLRPNNLVWFLVDRLCISYISVHIYNPVVKAWHDQVPVLGRCMFTQTLASNFTGSTK